MLLDLPLHLHLHAGHGSGQGQRHLGLFLEPPLDPPEPPAVVQRTQVRVLLPSVPVGQRGALLALRGQRRATRKDLGLEGEIGEAGVRLLAAPHSPSPLAVLAGSAVSFICPPAMASCVKQ